jgi:hypothetical protein
MLRRLIQLHTVILAAASVALLIAPGAALAELGIVTPNFPVLALTRLIAALLVIAAAAVLPLSQVTPAARRPALWGLTAAYSASTLLLLVQEIAIWGSTTGAIVVITAGVLSCAFAAAAVAERRHRVTGV